jgi:hypothetical protein
MTLSYIGCSISDQEANLLMLKMPRACLENEIKATNQRWWDYRGTHPVQATYLFAHEYRQATIGWSKMCRDEASAEALARPFTPDDIFKSRDLNAMWMARQHADLLCIPYGFLMHFAMQRSLNMTMRHMPRPNQLYSEEFHIDLIPAWEQRRRDFLQLPMSYDFCNRLKSTTEQSAWKGQFINWLFEEVDKRQAPHDRILGRLIYQGYFTEDQVLEKCGEEVFQAATRTANLLRSQELHAVSQC